ncbi:MAG: hypothetical protein IPJ00_21480 [Saprospirales bacterium]|nr:hypothetical protein [Saprospirales bacterium]
MLPEALKLFQEMALVDPQNADAHYNSGLLYLDMDSIPQAYQAFNLAIQTDPVHPGLFLSGNFRGNARQKEQARADYAQALRLAPDYQDARSALEALGGKAVTRAIFSRMRATLLTSLVHKKGMYG